MLFRKSGTFRNIGTQICHKRTLDASILQFCQESMPLDPPNKARLYSLEPTFYIRSWLKTWPSQFLSMLPVLLVILYSA